MNGRGDRPASGGASACRALQGGRPARRGEAGYNFVALVIAFTVLNIFMAAALPMWSKQIQREKEQELIARGLQYAEAIRVFQGRFGRLPIRLEELIQVKPRSIRQLWKDPMTEEGEWTLVRDDRGNRGRPPGGNQPNGQQGTDRPNANQPLQGTGPGGRNPGGPNQGREGTQGQLVGVNIAGVVSQSDETSSQIWNNSDKYNQWKFTYHLLASASQGFAVPGQNNNTPNLMSSRWLGRPFRPGLVPVAMGGPGGALPQGTGPDGRPFDPNQLNGGQQGRGGQNRPGSSFGGGQAPRNSGFGSPGADGRKPGGGGRR